MDQAAYLSSPSAFSSASLSPSPLLNDTLPSWTNEEEHLMMCELGSGPQAAVNGGYYRPPPTNAVGPAPAVPVSFDAEQVLASYEELFGENSGLTVSADIYSHTNAQLGLAGEEETTEPSHLAVAAGSSVENRLVHALHQDGYYSAGPSTAQPQAAAHVTAPATPFSFGGLSVPAIGTFPQPAALVPEAATSPVEAGPSTIPQKRGRGRPRKTAEEKKMPTGYWCRFGCPLAKPLQSSEGLCHHMAEVHQLFHPQSTILGCIGCNKRFYRQADLNKHRRKQGFCKQLNFTNAQYAHPAPRTREEYADTFALDKDVAVANCLIAGREHLPGRGDPALPAASPAAPVAAVAAPTQQRRATKLARRAAVAAATAITTSTTIPAAAASPAAQISSQEQQEDSEDLLAAVRAFLEDPTSVYNEQLTPAVDPVAPAMQQQDSGVAFPDATTDQQHPKEASELFADVDFNSFLAPEAYMPNYSDPQVAQYAPGEPYFEQDWSFFDL